MIVKAWNNGSHHPDGNGYGLKISVHDRDLYFHPDWETIMVELEGSNLQIEVNINKESFWNKTCCEIISKEIGEWLITYHLSQWPSRQPPELELLMVGQRKYLLKIPK